MTLESKDLGNGTMIIYGFRKHHIRFDMIMTLEWQDDAVVVHGFLSKGLLNLPELTTLWKYLKKVVNRPYLKFECVPDHSRVYKQFLHVVNSVITKTFNGHVCEQLTVDMRSGIKYFEKSMAV